MKLHEWVCVCMFHCRLNMDHVLVGWNVSQVWCLIPPSSGLPVIPGRWGMVTKTKKSLTWVSLGPDRLNAGHGIQQGLDTKCLIQRCEGFIKSSWIRVLLSKRTWIGASFLFFFLRCYWWPSLSFIPQWPSLPPCIDTLCSLSLRLAWAYADLASRPKVRTCCPCFSPEAQNSSGQWGTCACWNV